MGRREEHVNRLLKDIDSIAEALRRHGPAPFLLAVELVVPETSPGAGLGVLEPDFSPSLRRAISEAIESKQGTILHIAGNALMASVPGARQAVAAAAEIQRALPEWMPTEKGPAGAKARIGIVRNPSNTGASQVEIPTIRAAAELVSRARAAQVLISQSVAEGLAGKPAIRCSEASLAREDAMAAREKVFDVDWEGIAEAEPLREQARGTALTQALSAPGNVAGGLIRVLTDPIPERIGAYRIERLLGKGGMGIVYLAEQERPVRRRVALKVIQPQVDSAEVLVRFQAERQALASLEHPNIAKVFDAGTSEQGRPYFVMEYVDGIPFRAFCDRHRLDLEERLELFLPICEALHHAHRRGIIHRDVKPSNVLVAQVDGKPLPKLIDFGLAKATEMQLSDETLRTRYGQIMGTPSYMSPEQAGLTEAGIDSASDIYSLGVMLYELLTGTLPFDSDQLMKKGYGELQRVIREVDPPKPSSRLLEASAAPTESGEGGSRESKSISRALRGDLDWITMRAMEKDRARRYASAALLAEDIRRYLRHEPILAGPPSLSYRFRKLVKRKPVHTVLATVLIFLLPTGAWLGYSALAQRQRLRGIRIEELKREFISAGTDEQRLESLSRELLELDPKNVQGLRNLAMAHFNRSLHGDPASRESGESRRQALELADQITRMLPGRSWPIKLKARFLEKYGQKDEADRLRRDAPQAANPTSDDLVFEARDLVDQARNQGDLQKAEALLDQAILHGERSDAIALRGLVRNKLGDLDGAMDDYRLLAMREPEEYYYQMEIGNVLIDKGRFQEADDHLQRALDLASKKDYWANQKWGIHNRRAHNFNLWSAQLVDEGNPAEALRRSVDAGEQARAGLLLAPREPKLHFNLARSLRDQYHFSKPSGRDLIEASVEEFEKARSLALERKRPEDLEVNKIVPTGICDAYLELGDVQAAMPHCVEATAVLPENPDVHYNLAGALALAGRNDEAMASLEKDFSLGDRNFTYLRNDSWFRSLREDRRFKNLLRQMQVASSHTQAH